MVPASLYLGFTASIIWVGQVMLLLEFSRKCYIYCFFPPQAPILQFQGTYLTSAALSHARENNLPEGPTLGSFNGEFWGMFASTQVQLFQELLFLKNARRYSSINSSFLNWTVDFSLDMSPLQYNSFKLIHTCELCRWLEIWSRLLCWEMERLASHCNISNCRFFLHLALCSW